MRYSVEHLKDPQKRRTYYIIRDMDTFEITLLPSKYLKHKIISNKSPNTVRRYAFSISYYMNYLDEIGLKITDIFDLKYMEQHDHFTKFLYWLKDGKHVEYTITVPSNNTCNIYLKDVIGMYKFLELEYEQFGNLKVLKGQEISYSNSVGVRKKISTRGFDGYLVPEEHKGPTIEKNEIQKLLQACSNLRDQVLLLLMAETGFRIGEILGIQYTSDIDFTKECILVNYREDNPNNARAKYAECRRAKISHSTYRILMVYLSEYRDYLKDTEYLFVTISGEKVGKVMDVDAVYAMLRRLQKKTGIEVRPHMLRRYFANQRRKSNWDLLLISQALGHKHIETTIRYLKVGEDELVETSEAYYKAHPALMGIDQLV